MEKPAIKKGDMTREYLFMCDRVQAMSTGLFQKDAITDIGHFDEKLMRHEDDEFMIRFFRRYKLGAVGESLVLVDQVRKRNLNVYDLPKIKSRYLGAVRKDIERLRPAEASEVYARHWLMVAKSFVRRGKFRESLPYLKHSISYKVLPIWEYTDMPFKKFKRALVTNGSS